MLVKNLRALRLAAGKKQYEMADMMGVSRTTYVRWENGDNLIDIETLKKLANYFNVTVDYLLDQEPENDEEDEIWQLREELRRNPDLNVLLSMAKGATREDIIKTVKMLKVMKGDDT